MKVKRIVRTDEGVQSKRVVLSVHTLYACSVHQGYTMSTSRGYFEYIGGCSVHWGDTMIHVGEQFDKSL